MLRLVRICSFVLVVCLTSGCSTVVNIVTIKQVKPWERGTLARENMQIVNDAIEQSVDDHIYYSREGSTGGASVQGGGCGCN